ncbi:MAG: DUF2383 domain-containing protein [Alphaproteobacteria bacterium]|jgi:hypothetical protein|nr:PA2169 family four-helix-bundle protein [Candidatus Jidaibacter sp.]
MKTHDVTDILQKLIQYEIDATFILAQAISCLSNTKIRDKVSKIREECEHNIKVISSILMAHGASPPEHTRDFKGFFMQGYTGMRGLMSDQGAMKALGTNTRMLLNAFDEAMQANMPADVKQKISKVLDNFQEHLKYFESQS